MKENDPFTLVTRSRCRLQAGRAGPESEEAEAAELLEPGGEVAELLELMKVAEWLPSPGEMEAQLPMVPTTFSLEHEEVPDGEKPRPAANAALM